MLAGAESTAPNRSSPNLDCSPVILAHEQPFEIGSAEFRPATREVLFAGQSSIVEPRVMQLLVALRRADGGVVSKDDLANLCWEGRIVGEDAINRVVSRLRAVAEKQAGSQFRVETITKVGYRLTRANGGSEAPVETAVPASGLGRRDLLIGGGAVAAVATAGALGWSWLNADPLPPEARVLADDARNSLYQATVEQTANAVGKLRQATQLAPGSAEAWGLLSLAYASTALAAPAAQRPNLLARTNEARERAFAIEPDQPDALAAGLFEVPVFRNWYDRETVTRAALRRHPNHPVLQVQLAHVLVEAGRFREALALYQSSLRHTPLCAPSLICQICILWDMGRFDEADSLVDHASELLPGQYGIWFTKLYYRMYNGRAPEAVAMVEDVTTRPLGIPNWNYDLVALAARAIASGDRAALRHAVSAWSAAAPRGTGFAENAAILAAFAGDVDGAFRNLEALYFNRGFPMPDLYFSEDQRMYVGSERNTHALFRRPIAAIRRDPRFAQLTRDLGLDDYWRRTNSRGLVIA